jgi:multidrug efflux pump subunit AcrB
MSATDLSWFIDDRIARELQSVKGVGQISRVGGVNREINVTLDPVRMSSLGVIASDVNTALQRNYRNYGGGRAEVGGLILMSLDATAGTDSLVVDLEAGRLEIFLGPLAVEDRRERRARAVERLRGLRRRESRGQETCAECAECGEPPANLPSVHACHGWFAPWSCAASVGLTTRFPMSVATECIQT